MPTSSLNELIDNKWLRTLSLGFGVYGLISFLTFLYNADNQKLYLSSDEEPTLMLKRKRNWGLTIDNYELKFINGHWKWRIERETKILKNGMQIIEYGEWKSASLSYDVLDIENLGYDIIDE